MSSADGLTGNSAEGLHTSKVPEATAFFWLIKIIATTLGETGGDAVTMSLNMGYLLGTLIFLGVFLVSVHFQILARRFHPFLYWLAIVSTTTVGTTMADFVDRSLGIGYAGGSTLLFLLLMATLGLWYKATGSLSIASVNSFRTELFYWVTILFSQTLGTALGDYLADQPGLGYLGGAGVFTIGLLVILLLYYRTRLSRVGLFWAAFILTRPFGATLGDFLDKPLAQGGLALDRITASQVLSGLMAVLVFLLPQKPASAQSAH